MGSRLVLVLGDLYIPDRAPDIPAKFKKLLSPGKISQILFLGNLTSPSAYAFLRSIAQDIHLVRGELDLDGAYPRPPLSGPPQHHQSPAVLPSSAGIPPNLPVSKVVQHGSLRIGFTHGHTIIPNGDADALLIAARHMDVDVLCWGGTGRFEAYEMEGKFFVNPGSATGAISWDWQNKDNEGEQIPSFCLVDVQGDVLVLYVYQLKPDADGNESVSVEKVSFRKETKTEEATQA